MATPKTIDEALTLAQRAIRAADQARTEADAQAAVFKAFANMVREGRERGTSPAKLIDAVVKDLDSLTNGEPFDHTNVRAVSDTVYGAATTDKIIRETDMIAGLMSILMNAR